jgi:hypothetical protein
LLMTFRISVILQSGYFCGKFEERSHMFEESSDGD